MLISLLFVGVALVSGFLFYQMKESASWVAHTQEVLYQQSEIYSSLQDMNLASRGYAFTGEQSILGPYDAGRGEYPVRIGELSTLTSDNPRQKGNIESLSGAARAFDDVTVQLIKTRSKAVVSAQMAAMDKIRSALRVVSGEENRLLAERTQRSDVLFKLGLGLIAVQLTLGLLLLATCRRTVTNYAEEDRRKIEKLEAEIDQRKKTEKALKETTLKLTSSNTDLQQFAYVASHDLQEPLRAVAGFLTLIAKKHRGNLDSDTDVWITHAVDGAQRMRNLINDLLMYSRVESRGKDLEVTDCNKALEQAKSDLSVLIKEANAIIEAGKLPTVQGEQGQLSQVFQNLLGNAIKFKGTDRPVIDITVSQQSNEWLFAVKDNGIGFDQAHADRIFVIFQRLQGREQYPGTGIGLSLCKKIVERHGGRIWAESTKGSGSTFFFTIPVMQGEYDGRAKTD